MTKRTPSADNNTYTNVSEKTKDMIIKEVKHYLEINKSSILKNDVIGITILKTIDLMEDYCDVKNYV